MVLYNNIIFYQVLQTLKLLPINNRTILKESKILGMVTKWASQDITVSSSDTFKGAFKQPDIKPDTNKEAISTKGIDSIKEEIIDSGEAKMESETDKEPGMEASSEGNKAEVKVESAEENGSQPTTPTAMKDELNSGNILF